MKDRTYEIGRNCGYDGYQRALASIVYNFHSKKEKPMRDLKTIFREQI